MRDYSKLDKEELVKRIEEAGKILSDVIESAREKAACEDGSVSYFVLAGILERHYMCLNRTTHGLGTRKFCG